jgi:hypothetical protein
MIVKLTKPITVGDKTIDEVKLDVEAITGGDIMFCVNEAAARKGVVVSYPIDPEVHLQMAAKLTGLDREVLTKISGRDFNAIIGPVRDFFLGTD